MILLHLDVPMWTNAGGVIVLPALLLIAVTAASHLIRNRHHRETRP